MSDNFEKLVDAARFEQQARGSEADERLAEFARMRAEHEAAITEEAKQLISVVLSFLTTHNVPTKSFVTTHRVKSGITRNSNPYSRIK